MLNLPIADALSRYLDLQSQQMRATAANMANVDTPGYRTIGIDFQKEFSQALDSHTGSTREAMLSNVEGLVSRPDGNNVRWTVKACRWHKRSCSSGRAWSFSSISFKCFPMPSSRMGGKERL